MQSDEDAVCCEMARHSDHSLCTVLSALLLLFSQAAGNPDFFWASHLGLCERPWRKVYEHDHTGATLAGHHQALYDAAIAGDIIRVVVHWISDLGEEGTVLVLQADNAITTRSEVCIQALFSLNHFPYNSSNQGKQQDALWHSLLCSSGRLQVLGVQLGHRTLLTHRHLNASAAWFLKSWASGRWQHCPISTDCGSRSGEREDDDGRAISVRCDGGPSSLWPVYSSFVSGEVAGGSKLSVLLEAVRRGQDVRGSMRDRGYSFPLHTVHWGEGHHPWVGGQSVAHVGVRHFSSRVILRTRNPYLWLSSWSTTGRRHNLRWALDGGGSRGANQDMAALDWMTDACWRHVYTNDETGQPLKGSLQDLLLSVRAGHRVRVVVENMAAEADIIRVRAGHVAAQLLTQLMASESRTSVDSAHLELNQARWVWKVVHTTGTVLLHEVLLSNHSMSAESLSSSSVAWFVDTRPWTALLSLANQNITAGHVNGLVAAISNGASVRVRIHHIANDGEIFAPAVNLRISTAKTDYPVISGQVIRYLGDEAYGVSEVRFQRELVWWMTTLDTNGVMYLSAWNTGHTLRFFDISLTPQIDWFVNV